MYYVKSKINDEVEIRTEISDENVFTQCAECGKEMQVDFFELCESYLNNGNLNAVKNFCCKECHEKYNNKKH